MPGAKFQSVMHAAALIAVKLDASAATRAPRHGDAWWTVPEVQTTARVMVRESSCRRTRGSLVRISFPSVSTQRRTGVRPHIANA